MNDSSPNVDKAGTPVVVETGVRTGAELSSIRSTRLRPRLRSWSSNFLRGVRMNDDSYLAIVFGYRCCCCCYVLAQSFLM